LVSIAEMILSKGGYGRDVITFCFDIPVFYVSHIPPEIVIFAA